MNTSPRIVRLSLGTLILIGILLCCVGFIGAYIGAKISSPKQIIQVSKNQEIVVPTSQQITVSPSKLASDIVTSKARSIVLLARQTPKGIIPFGVGIILTNDGIILSVQDATGEDLVAIGDDKTPMPISFVDTDAVTSLHFYKTNRGIVAPIDLSHADPKIGSHVLTIARLQDTLNPSAEESQLSRISGYVNEKTPGILRIGHLQTLTDNIPVGSPILNEDGTLEGLLLSQDTSAVLFSADIRKALDRFLSHTLSVNPYDDYGFTLAWKLIPDSNALFTMRAVVNSVTSSSPAGKNGLKNGDIITSINGKAITWDNDITNILTSSTLELGILQGTQSKIVTISKN